MVSASQHVGSLRSSGAPFVLTMSAQTATDGVGKANPHAESTTLHESDAVDEKRDENIPTMEELLEKMPPVWKNPQQIKLYCLLIAPLLTSTAWGFDLSMTNGLQSLNQFMDKFGNPKGSELGFFGAAQSVGGLIACIIGGSLTDRFGRRLLGSVGAAIVIGMAFMQTFSTSFAMFTGGKLVLGFGANLQQLAGPVLITELAHPKHRVLITSLYNTSIFLGLVIGSWITFGTFRIEGEWSWKIPCILQAALPAYQVVMFWLCPESPRWLASKGRVTEARDILIKYHSTIKGVEDEIVRNEIEEILAGIEADKTQLKFNKEGIKSILGSKGNLWRLWLGLWCALGSQCGGGTFIAMYLPQILDQVGMTSTKDKTLINAIMQICNWIQCVIAALIIPRIKRRTMFLFSSIGMTAAFVVWTAFSARYTMTLQESFGTGVIVMIFVYNLFQTVCWIPLVIAYPLEVVTTKQRGVFFAFTMFCINITAFISSYISPIGLDAIGWKWYLIQIVFNLLIIASIYFTFVETKGLALEEIAVIFDGEEAFNQAKQHTKGVLDTLEKDEEGTVHAHLEHEKADKVDK